jgi:hypothetical protein
VSAPKSRGRRPVNLRRNKVRDPIHDEIVHRAGNVVGIAVSHELPGPYDANSRRWPNAKERAFMWEGEPPPFDEAARRRTYDMNKHLTDDLGSDVTIVVGSPYIRSASEFLFRRIIKKRKR